jgi:hypothetical protein
VVAAYDGARVNGTNPSNTQERFRGIAELPRDQASAREALLPTPVGASRFVTRTTHEHGVGVRRAGA